MRAITGVTSSVSLFSGVTESLSFDALGPLCPFSENSDCFIHFVQFSSYLQPWASIVLGLHCIMAKIMHVCVFYLSHSLTVSNISYSKYHPKYHCLKKEKRKEKDNNKLQLYIGPESLKKKQTNIKVVHRFLLWGFLDNFIQAELFIYPVSCIYLSTVLWEKQWYHA